MKHIKLIGYTPTGGKVTLSQMLPYGTSGGARDLNQAQFDAYKRARLVADTRNDGDLDKAKALLEAAGFETYWE